jgi:hypothetical protein
MRPTGTATINSPGLAFTARPHYFLGCGTSAKIGFSLPFSRFGLISAGQRLKKFCKYLLRSKNLLLYSALLRWEANGAAKNRATDN